MFKAITYLSSALLIATIVTSTSKSQIAFAQTVGSSASSSSTTTTSPSTGTQTLQQATVSTTSNGTTLTKTITETTGLDVNGKPVANPSPPGVQGNPAVIMIPTIPVQIVLPNN
jgi:hypothetical protein